MKTEKEKKIAKVLHAKLFAVSVLFRVNSLWKNNHREVKRWKVHFVVILGV